MNSINTSSSSTTGEISKTECDIAEDHSTLFLNVPLHDLFSMILQRIEKPSQNELIHIHDQHLPPTKNRLIRLSPNEKVFIFILRTLELIVNNELLVSH